MLRFIDLIKTALNKSMDNVIVFWSNTDQCYRAMGVDKKTSKTILFHSATKYDSNRELVDLKLTDNVSIQMRKITAN